MKVILTKKMSDDWSRIDLYQGCKHRIGSYYKRTGNIYTGDLSDVEKKYFEKLLGQNLNDKLENGEMNPFWVNYHVMLDSKNKLIFDTNIANEEFDVRFLEKHKDVSLGYTDRKPGTRYVLIKEEDEAEVKIKKADIKIKATIAYNDMNPEQRKKALRMLGYNPNSMSDAVISSTLWQIVEDDPGKFLDTWVNNPNKEVQFLIEEAVANNILRHNKTIYKYGTDVIGYTLEETIDYLKDPRNSSIRLAILAQMDGKKAVEASSEQRTAETQFSKLLKEIEEDEVQELTGKVVEEESEAVATKVTSENKATPKKKSSTTNKDK